MRILVLGAGVVGVTAAWYLRAGRPRRHGRRPPRGRRARDVVRQRRADLRVVRRAVGQPGSAGQDPKWLGQEDAPLLFRLRLDPRQWRWGLQFLLECLPSRTRRNTIQCLNLALYSRDCLQELRAADRHRVRPSRARHPVVLHRCARSSRTASRRRAHARVRLRPRREDGRRVRRASSPRSRRAATSSPAASSRRATNRATRSASRRSSRAWPRRAACSLPLEHAGRVARGRRRRGDERALRQRGASQGDPARRRLRRGARQLQPVPAVAARRAVPHLSGQGLLGHDRRSTSHRGAPTVSLTDLAWKIVFTRLGDRLRVAGTAELSGYGKELNLVRCEALVQPHVRPVPRRRRPRQRAVLDRPAARHAVERAADRRHPLPQPLPQHRPRHARLDDGLRLGSRARGCHRRAKAWRGLCVYAQAHDAPIAQPLAGFRPASRRSAR